METDEAEQRFITSNRLARYARFRAELRDFERFPRWFKWLRIQLASGSVPMDTYEEEVEYRNRMAKKLRGLV
jgi:hypothetical protein